MVSKSKKVMEEALNLSPAERASLVDQLLSSLDTPDEKIDNLWRKEISDRLAAYRSGKVETISADELFQKCKN